MSDKHDPITEIDMEDPANFRKAIELALAATDATGWCELDTSLLHSFAGDSPRLWAAYKDMPGGAHVSAVSGNGPKSAANAEFYASARKVVLGLVSEVDRLRTIISNQHSASGGKGKGEEAGR